jgi:hypothetical protein
MVGYRGERSQLNKLIQLAGNLADENQEIQRRSVTVNNCKIKYTVDENRLIKSAT